MHIASAVLSRSVAKDLLLQIVQRPGGHPVPLVRIIQMIQRDSTSLSRDIHGQRHRRDQTRNRARQRQRNARRSRPEGCKFTTESSEHQQKDFQKNHIDSNQALAEDHAEPNGQLQKNQQNPANILSKTLRKTSGFQSGTCRSHAESNGQLQKNQQNPVNIIREYIDM